MCAQTSDSIGMWVQVQWPIESIYQICECFSEHGGNPNSSIEYVLEVECMDPVDHSQQASSAILALAFVCR
jgi:hypothetical protein